MRRSKNHLKTIFNQRVHYFFEILIIFLGIFIFMLIPAVLLPILIDFNSVIFEPIFFILRVVIIIVVIPLFLYLSNFLMAPQKRELILEEDINSSKNFLNLFNITKKNFKYQFLYGILLLFLVFIPLDFFTYLFLPDMLSYLSIVINPTGELSYNSYFMESYYVFLISVIIIQTSVAIYEETLFRGFLANRGSAYFKKMSAVIITSFVFGLGHFSYIFTIPSIGLPIIFPIIWFFQSFLVGVILAMLVLRRRWIFPVIFAHAVNNIISAHSIWNFIHGNDYTLMSFFVYVPLLIISIFLFVWQFSRIKESLSIGFKEFISYFKKDNEMGEDWLEKIVGIIIDFLFGLIIFTIVIIIL